MSRAAGDERPHPAPLDVSLPAALLTRRARLSGDSIALALRCPAGAAGSMGTVTLRTAGRLRGARRGLGLAASILTRGDGAVSLSTATLALAPTRAARSRSGGARRLARSGR